MAPLFCWSDLDHNRSWLLACWLLASICRVRCFDIKIVSRAVSTAKDAKDAKGRQRKQRKNKKLANGFPRIPNIRAVRQ
jgi:hypothetical protein